jgi:hypothetical protein
VRVGVVEALGRDLADVGAEELAGQRPRLLGLDVHVRLDLYAVEPLEHEHVLTHVRMDHPGYVQELEVGDQAGDQLRVVRFLDEVQLGDLGDRARGERLRVDTRERVPAERILDHPLDLLERQRRDLVDEPAELLDVHVRQQVWTRREQLAELDERRAELLEGGTNASARSWVASPPPPTPTSRKTLSSFVRRATPVTSSARLRRRLRVATAASCGTATTPCLTRSFEVGKKAPAPPSGDA